MAQTRAFKSGNSQAVRIPAELAYADLDRELTITRCGDVITIMPRLPSLVQAIAELRALPEVPVEEREPIEMPERD